VGIDSNGKIHRGKYIILGIVRNSECIFWVKHERLSSNHSPVACAPAVVDAERWAPFTLFVPASIWNFLYWSFEWKWVLWQNQRFVGLFFSYTTGWEFGWEPFRHFASIYVRPNTSPHTKKSSSHPSSVTTCGLKIKIKLVISAFVILSTLMIGPGHSTASQNRTPLQYTDADWCISHGFISTVSLTVDVESVRIIASYWELGT